MRERHPLAFQLSLGLLAAVVGLVLPWSCDPPLHPEIPEGEEALQELLSYGEPEAFRELYWLTEAREGSDLWQRAVGVCSSRLKSPTPSCLAVFRAEILTRLEESSP